MAIGLVCSSFKSDDFKSEITATLRQQVLKEANWAMQQKPLTVTAFRAERSAGGLHDFYSEGDYWWPNPENPNGAYIQKDGLTNPQNFVAHRQAMIRFSQIIGALASAYQLTGNDNYVKQAVLHLNAWFINANTKMNPNLLYAQAIKGVATGRGIGIIDTIQLMEVVQGMLAMQKSKALPKQTINGAKNWFALYLEWLTTHQYGKDEMNAKNNHGTCWVMQVACFAKFTQNQQLIDFCKERYKTVILPQQMTSDGSLPLELKRTKPYGYSIFNLDALATICQLLSTPQDNLWHYQTADGLGIQKGIAFLYPFLADKDKWPYAKDVMHWESWPVAQPSILFGAMAYQQKDWLNTWKAAEHNPKNEEIIRNLPVRHPLIWLD
ncbi:alginate lyase family protein [Pedobacter sp. KR3-3]|uniref:Alginate lyase family protein n=1 Tax=Pedobacter albus TaxID=3113905 RepID=A0ABU7I2B7_9SPHI|nr:alginate lyase family protein [Pedobacter sp. KR3-3]MEE1943602.1 alginate lyase family protein [Pedobacter sp. KR3-3]